MDSIGLELAIIAALIVLNGLFAMAEMAMVAAKKARLRTRAESGDKTAIAALALAEQPDRLLSTVQIGITLIGVLAGAFAGATVSEKLAASLKGLPLIAGREEGVAVGIVVALITFASLIIGELVPKQLALRSPESVACLVARPMTRLTKLAKPFVWLLTACSNGLMRLFGLTPIDADRLTEEDLKGTLRESRESGVVHPLEADILEKAARLEDIPVRRIMTPRHDIVWLDTGLTPTQNLARIAAAPHSYFPVCQDTPDDILGMVPVRSLLAAGYGRGSDDLMACVEKLTFVPESISLVRLLELLKEQRASMVMVLDEYGGVEGLATLNDVMEAIVGDLPGVSDPSDWFAKRQDGTWLVDGAMTLAEMAERLDINPALLATSAETVGGYLYQSLSQGLRVGEASPLGPLSLEIADMDGHRIDKVLVHLNR